MKKSISGRMPWLVCAAAAAVISAALRLWQLATAFEGPLSLPIPGAQASVILVCVLVIAGACFTLLAAYQPVAKRPWAKGQAHRWDLAFLDPTDKVYPILLVAAAFLMLAAVPGLFLRGMAQREAYQAALYSDHPLTDNGFLMLGTAMGALLSFFGLLQMGRESFRPGQRGKGGFAAALPGVAGCVWLMTWFRSHAADPVLWDYAPQLLAIVCGMLFYMDSAGMSTGAARPRRLLWLAGMTVALSTVAMVSRPSAGDLLLLAAQTLAALATLWRLPPNLENPPPIGPSAARRRDFEQEQERQEESSHE